MELLRRHVRELLDLPLQLLYPLMCLLKIGIALGVGVRRVVIRRGDAGALIGE